MKENIFNLLLKICFIVMLLFLSAKTVENKITTVNLDKSKHEMETYDKQKYVQNYVNYIKQQSLNNLISEVDVYIKQNFPKSKITSKCLVKNCLKYNIDITFVLSQGIIESHLGTLGRAKQTNSVWNVGTFDNGKVLYRYKTADESIEPYLVLLKRDYLIIIKKSYNKIDTIEKSIPYLLSKGFHNTKGHRFAANKHYEKKILEIMETINNNTSISMYQSLVKLEGKKIANTFIQ